MMGIFSVWKSCFRTRTMSLPEMSGIMRSVRMISGWNTSSCVWNSSRFEAIATL